jgi:hypothetical protein
MPDFFENQIPQVSWTLAQYLVQNISNLFQRAADAYLSRNYQKYFECLTEIKQSAIQSFNANERGELDKQEKEIALFLGYLSNENLKANNFKLWKKINNKIYSLVNKYRTSLMDCLQKHGYLNPDKKDRTKLMG